MMKKISLMLIAVFIMGCNNDKQQEKSLFKDVIKIHDKVMADDEVIMKNKMQLDTLSARSPNQGVKDSIAYYKNLLSDADDAMMNWMNKFNPELTGKSHEEIMDYLSKQKEQILKVNSHLNKVIAASDRYLVKIKGK